MSLQCSGLGIWYPNRNVLITLIGIVDTEAITRLASVIEASISAQV